MPSKKTVDGWGFDCIGYESDVNHEVTLIWCKICREYSQLTTVSHAKKGVAKVASETFVKGTKVVKKNNFADHVKKSVTHAAAVVRLAEKRKQSTIQNVDLTTDSNTGPSQRQQSLMPFIQKLNVQQKTQLLKKMQLAHFTAINAKSFSFYETLSKFLKNTMKVYFKVSSPLFWPEFCFQCQ